MAIEVEQRYLLPSLPRGKGQAANYVKLIFLENGWSGANTSSRTPAERAWR